MQALQAQEPGVVGAPGPEEDHVSQEAVLVTKLRLQTKPAQAVRTILREKTFNIILIRKLSTLESLGSLSSQNSPLFTDPDQSMFGDLCWR